MNSVPLPFRCARIVGLGLALSACDTPPTAVDQHFGMAVQSAQIQQRLLDPRDGMGRQIARETDGAAALAAVMRYQQSFQTPPAPTPMFTSGVGAISAP